MAKWTADDMPDQTGRTILVTKPGVLEEIAVKAELTPEQTFDAIWTLEYRGEEPLRRAMVAPAGIAVLVGPDREEEVKDAIVAGLAQYRTPDGIYRLQNEFHFLIARV
jgi:hypothetical protein